MAPARQSQISILQFLPEKVQLASSHPDLKSKQLVALICGELFLVWRRGVTPPMKPDALSSNRRRYSGCDKGQLLEPTTKSEVAEFKSSRHSRGWSLRFESCRRQLPASIRTISPRSQRLCPRDLLMMGIRSVASTSFSPIHGGLVP